jgi:flagellar protein FlaG
MRWKAGLRSREPDPAVFLPGMNYPESIMSSTHTQPRINLTNAPDYRESYANSVQIRVSMWDFHLTFGTLRQESSEEVNIENHQGIYLSPQQAKAFWNILGQNLAQYQQTFGNIALEPHPPQISNGPVN